MTIAAEKVKSARLRLGLTQKQLSKVAGVGRSTIWAIESGKTEIMTPETARRLAKVFGCSPDYLLEIEEFEWGCGSLSELLEFYGKDEEWLTELISMPVSSFAIMCKRARCNPSWVLMELLDGNKEKDDE